jgi:hypothetical protein
LVLEKISWWRKSSTNSGTCTNYSTCAVSFFCPFFDFLLIGLKVNANVTSTFFISQLSWKFVIFPVSFYLLYSLLHDYYILFSSWKAALLLTNRV